MSKQRVRPTSRFKKQAARKSLPRRLVVMGLLLVVLVVLGAIYLLRIIYAVPDDKRVQDLITIERELKASKKDLPSSLDELSFQNLAAKISDYRYTLKYQTQGAPSTVYQICADFQEDSLKAPVRAEMEREWGGDQNHTDNYKIHRRGEQCFDVSTSAKGTQVRPVLRDNDIKPEVIKTRHVNSDKVVEYATNKRREHLQILGLKGAEGSMTQYCTNEKDKYRIGDSLNRQFYSCYVSNLLSAPVQIPLENAKGIFDRFTELIKSQGAKYPLPVEGTDIAKSPAVVQKYYHYYVSEDISGVEESPCHVSVSYSTATTDLVYSIDCKISYVAEIPNGFSLKKD